MPAVSNRDVRKSFFESCYRPKIEIFVFGGISGNAVQNNQIFFSQNFYRAFKFFHRAHAGGQNNRWLRPKARKATKYFSLCSIYLFPDTRLQSIPAPISNRH